MDVEQMKPEDFEAAEEDMEDVTKPGVDISLTDDGGVVKRISTMGSGWDTPEKGDEVTVHYTGTLTDGTKFDSSVDRGDPFSFTLGEGSVIKSWDIGVATMRKGEKALLIAKPEYAYGAQGSPPKIPPNSTLHFEVELISWKSIKDISGDGGVIKTIKHEASGWEKPSERDVAQYTYSITVEGKAEVVAQSPEGGASHEVASACPLKAFSHALPTMKKGEVVHLCVTSQYGFEAGQLPQGVSNSDQLEATLELTGWQKVEDVTADGAIVKKTVVSSEEWKKPNVGATVTVHLTGRLSDGGVFEDQELTFVTDEEQVPEGVELAVHKMKLGETAEVSVAAKYAFGDDGCDSRAGGSVSVPAGADVTWTIRLIDLKNAKASYDMSDEEKVAAALTAKEKGNARFKAGKWVAALVKYKAAVDLTKSDKDFSASQRTSARDTCRAAQLNSAACHMKLGNARECLNAANEVLSKESGNVKALYRAGQGHLALRDYVEAEAVIRKGLSEDPTNSALRTLLKEYKKQAAESNKKDRTMFSKMFRPSKRSTADTATSASADVSQSAASAPPVGEQAAQASESPSSHPIMTAPSEEMVEQSGGTNEARGGTDGATAMETS